MIEMIGVERRLTTISVFCHHYWPLHDTRLAMSNASATDDDNDDDVFSHA